MSESKYALKKGKVQLDKYAKLLAGTLCHKLDEDSYICTMLALMQDKEDSEKNCKELYEYMQNNPDANYDAIMDKSFDIQGIYIDEDDDTLPYYDEEDN